MNLIPFYDRLAVFAQVLLVLYAGSVLVAISLKFIIKYGATVTPVFIDGFLFTLLAVFTAIEAVYQSDEAYKYLSPYFVFYSKSIVGVMLAGATSLKAFRSTSYSEHVKDKLDKARIATGNTETFTKPPGT